MEEEQYIGKIKKSSQQNQEQELHQQLENGTNLQPFGVSFLCWRKIHKTSDNDPPPSCSFQVSGRLQSNDHDKADKRLEEFIEYFVQEFEAKLYAYHMILEGKTKKAGKFSDTFSAIIGQGVGGAAGGLVGFFLGSPLAGAKTGAMAGKSGGKIIGNMIGSKKYAQEVTKLSDLIDFAQNDKITFRRALVEAGFDVFQSFEMQFMRVTTNLGPRKALQQLAKDATNRTIKYMKEKRDTSISESVILGESKRVSLFSIRPGYKIQYEYQSTKMAWNTASLYDKAGVIKESGSYYKKKGVEEGTTRYGYRRLLVQESWEKHENNYDSDNIEESKSYQFTDYQYTVSTNDLEKQLNNILDNLNSRDPNLEEDRIRTILKEVKKDILNELHNLKKLSRGYEEDRKILSEIKANLKNFKIDEYLEKFIQYFEEAKKERKKITESIEAGREENKENFDQLSHKQDINHKDNITEHKKTQEVIERVEEGIASNNKKIDEIHEVFIAQKTKQTIETVWFDVKNPSESFTGRVEQLEQLHVALQSRGETTISQTVSVSGLGGVGKSELVRKYAYDHGSDYEGNVIWINAESYETLAESFLRLAQNKLGMNVKELAGNKKDIKTVVDNVYGFFSNRKSLFIFDNAEKFKTQEDSDEGVYKFLPSLPTNVNKPYILITSRNQKWGDIKTLTLDIFTEFESINFIRKALSIKNESQENEIKNLAETLQHFPLTLQQAVAYITERDKVLKNIGSKFKISDYLKRYNKEIKKVLDFKFPDDSSDLYTKTTFTTWKITTNKIKKNNEYGMQAGEILDIIAYLAPDGIPIQMFLGLELIDDDQELLGDAVQLLRQYSMVNSGQVQTVLNVHRLVQEVTRIELQGQGKNEDIIQKVFGLLGKSFPYLNNKSEAYSKKRELLPHLEVFLIHIDSWIAKDPEDSKKKEDYLESLLSWISDAYTDLGDPRRKMNLLERALAISEKRYGPDHIEVANILVNLAISYLDLGDPKKQKLLLERALSIQEKYYGPDHVKIAGTLGNLGLAYGDLGDPYKKKELLERALKIVENYYGPDHIRVGRVLVNLGNSYGGFGNNQKKKELLERALKIAEKHYGPNHFEVARILVNLSNAYSNPRKQKELLERALAFQEKHYGPDYFEVARTLVNLGVTYGDLGDPQKKKDLLERALKIGERHFGPDNFHINITLLHLGVAYKDLGNPKKQTDILERILAIQEKHYGPGHFEVVSTLKNLGNAYSALGDPQKAYESYEKLSKVKEKQTPLHFAVCSGNLKTVEYILETGADILARNNHDTVLHQAVNSGNEEVIRLIVEKIIEKYPQKIYEHINAKDTEGDTPLMWAVQNGKTNAAKTLLEYGVDLNLQNNNGETALHWAVKGGHHECVKLLLENKTDSNIQNYNEKLSNITAKQTPLHLACKSGNLKTVEYILDMGADILARNNHDTVLHQAVSGGNIEIIRLIVDKIIEKDPQKIYEHINAKDTEGDTPLMWAVQNGKTNAAKILIEYGVDLNLQNNNGETALHWAAKGGYQECVKLLLENKADSNIQNNNGKTSLILSQEKLSQGQENENLKTIIGLLVSSRGPV